MNNITSAYSVLYHAIGIFINARGELGARFTSHEGDRGIGCLNVMVFARTPRDTRFFSLS